MVSPYLESRFNILVGSSVEVFTINLNEKVPYIVDLITEACPEIHPLLNGAVNILVAVPYNKWLTNILV